MGCRPLTLLALLLNSPVTFQGFFMFLFGACGASEGVWSVWSAAAAADHTLHTGKKIHSLRSLDEQ
ncbi:hypothetical protein [Dictyobacter kobayashii]|uniref:hypothetical protein n=1 Tax=Dictyobacter kobayashii TaxID=2014872 RepID=UPI000F84717E|nr:hypothetical protein [Dictyobacter kobayashii]